MAHLSDQELKELKSRVFSAMGTGASLGRANEHLLALIAEVEEHRKGTKKGELALIPSGGIKLTVGEMEVKKVGLPASPPLEAEVEKAEAPKEEEKRAEALLPPPPDADSKKKGGKKKG